MIDFPNAEERRAEAQRLLEGLGGQWVADRMSSGDYKVGKATVRLWRRGERVPDLEDLLRLPAATGRALDPALHAKMYGGTVPLALAIPEGHNERPRLPSMKGRRGR